MSQSNDETNWNEFLNILQYGEPNPPEVDITECPFFSPEQFSEAQLAEIYATRDRLAQKAREDELLQLEEQQKIAENNREREAELNERDNPLNYENPFDDIHNTDYYPEQRAALEAGEDLSSLPYNMDPDDYYDYYADYPG